MISGVVILMFGWSRAEVSLGYAIAAAGMAVGGLVWGRLSDRLDIRLLLAIGGTGMVLALAGMAATQSLWHFYAANLVLGGFGFAVLYAPLVSAPGEWFVKNRGLAIGIVTGPRLRNWCPQISTRLPSL